MRIIITGASGILGRSLLRLLSAAAADKNYTLLGLAYSRATPPLQKVDLCDEAATKAVIEEFKPDIVVHCAAERFPDKVDADPDRAKTLNVGACERLAAACADCGAALVYISTDYVFDGGVKTGVYPPYDTDAPPNPINFYGETKRAGEVAVLAVQAAHPCVLRVPVLYAYDQETLAESASLVVAEALKGSSSEPKLIDDWGVRFPTACDDVSEAIRLIIEAKREDKAKITGIYHCSSPERSTKYSQSLLMAKVLGLPSEHLKPNGEPPSGAPRPQNTQLDCSSTWAALGGKPQFKSLEEGFARALAPFKGEFGS